MASLEKRIAELESKIGSGKAWVIEHNGHCTIVSDAYLSRIHPVWRTMAVPWDGPCPDDVGGDLAGQIRSGRLVHLARCKAALENKHGKH